MMEIIAVRDLQYTYPNRSLPTLSDINLSVRQGEFVLITGQTGCGKSTLLKTLNGLIPHESGGVLTGSVLINGVDTLCASIADLSDQIGLLFQSPDDQIFSTSVGDEVAFVLENAGMPAKDITERVRDALTSVGLAERENDSVYTLSGGQKQRLTLAAVLAAQPKVLALDEPISQVDPRGAKEILDLLKQLNEQLGMTIILVEHRLHEVIPYCSRVIVMDAGRITSDSSKTELLETPAVLLKYGLRLPQPAALCWSVGVRPVELETGAAIAAIKRMLPSDSSGLPFYRQSVSKPLSQADILAVLTNVRFRYDGCEKDTLSNISFSVSSREVIAVMGTNGAGKSTLLQLLNGLLLPESGALTVAGKRAGEQLHRVGQVMQNPDFMLFNSTVTDEIGYATAADSELIANLIDRLSLAGLEAEFPLALSRGQRLRVAIAAVLATGPKLLLLDEPTTGQDFAQIEKISSVVREFAAQGGAVIFCTHDAEAAVRLANRVLVMSEGRIIRDGTPEQVFSDEQSLALAGLRIPPIILLSQALASRVLLSVEEVVDYVQQAVVGARCGE